MNRQQRMSNRANIRMLEDNANICPECGERGKHWMQLDDSLEVLIFAAAIPSGFWVCDKFYDENGVRIINS